MVVAIVLPSRAAMLKGSAPTALGDNGLILLVEASEARDYVQ